jgi:hypothetical protein
VKEAVGGYVGLKVENMGKRKGAYPTYVGNF